MKQVIQSFKTGELSIKDVPPPSLRPQGILVRNAASLVSAGTERMVVDFAEKNLLQKALNRPDLVKQVADKVQREGIINTLSSVRNRLDQPLALGYSSAGIVIEVGSEVSNFRVGDYVACAGGGYASHAEMIYVPQTLAVKLPDNVSFAEGAFATVGAIALQGIRQAEVILGHNVAVIGLGLIGQLTAQMLKASGCRVIGVDLIQARIDLALENGIDLAVHNKDALEKGSAFTNNFGFDAVIITAATTSNDPVELAGLLARDRAIISAVGAFGMNLPRKIYYEKELDFRLSRSYGPGRYDSDYEDKGRDYPYAYVRWTEQRNIEAVLHLISDGSLAIKPIISHKFPIEDAENAYALITGKTNTPFLGVLLTYDTEKSIAHKIDLTAPVSTYPTETDIHIGLVGAGNFTNATLLPAMKQVDHLNLIGIVSGSGMTAYSTGERYGFTYCADALDELLNDTQINWIVITTRHHLHAAQTIAALQAGKHVFVEKPLSLNRQELVDILQTHAGSDKRLIVGFNRRFAPMVQDMKAFLAEHTQPLIATYRINAGAIPASHWTQDPEIGGGRIIGEVCHFIDLLQYLIGSTPVQVQTFGIRKSSDHMTDEVLIILQFEDGSIGNIIYSAGGDKAYSKERIEIIGDNRVAVLDDYRLLELVHNGKRDVKRERLRPTKGHKEQWDALVHTVQTGDKSPITLDALVNSHLATFAAVDSLRLGHAVSLDRQKFWQDVNNPSKPTG